MRVSAGYELDMPVEPMRRRHQQPTSDRITPVTFLIQRKIDAAHPINMELDVFLQEADSINNPKKGKKNYPIKPFKGIATTYFSTLDLIAAVERQGTRGVFRNFGRDEKQTRDVMTRLKGSFMEYLRDSRVIHSVMAESRFMEPLIHGDFAEDEPSLSDGQPASPNDISNDIFVWDVAPVRIGDTMLALEGNKHIYAAVDLSANDFLAEERDGIRNHYKTEFGLNLLDRERWRDGKPLRHIMHATVVKVSEEIFAKHPPEFNELPRQAVFLGPEIEARAYTMK